MRTIARTALALVAGVLPLVLSQGAFAGTVVHVSLWDKGDHALDNMADAKPMGLAMMPDTDRMAAMKHAQVGIKVDRSEVPAGEVTFEATDDSKVMIHEMLVSPIKDAVTALPYIADELRVDEEVAGHLGEVAELDPGKTGSLTLTLAPGKYLLYCNLPGHYMMGMYTVITVKG